MSSATASRCPGGALAGESNADLGRRRLSSVTMPVFSSIHACDASNGNRNAYQTDRAAQPGPDAEGSAMALATLFMTL